MPGRSPEIVKELDEFAEKQGNHIKALRLIEKLSEAKIVKVLEEKYPGINRYVIKQAVNRWIGKISRAQKARRKI